MKRDRITRLFLWGAISLIAVILFFCAHPIIWQSDERLSPGTTITLDASGDFLLVVDYDLFEESPKRFPEMEFSLAWLNTIQQEIGPVTLLDAQGFSDATLDKYRCVILTHSASSHDAWAPKLRNYLERGGTLVMEMPTGALRTIASADGKGGLRNVQNITYAAGLSDELQKNLSALDLSNRTQIIGSASPLEDSTTYLTIDGIPAVYEKKYATGHVITLDFNYGMLMTSLQHRSMTFLSEISTTLPQSRPPIWRLMPIFLMTHRWQTFWSVFCSTVSWINIFLSSACGLSLTDKWEHSSSPIRNEGWAMMQLGCRNTNPRLERRQPCLFRLPPI